MLLMTDMRNFFYLIVDNHQAPTFTADKMWLNKILELSELHVTLQVTPFSKKLSLLLVLFQEVYLNLKPTSARKKTDIEID